MTYNNKTIDLSKIPKEIVSSNILPFLCQPCSECGNHIFFFDFTTNVEMKEYITIFDDNFYFSGEEEDKRTFHILCHRCYVSFLDDHLIRVK